MLDAFSWSIHFSQTKTNAVVESVQQITQTHTPMLESILGFFAFGALGFWLLLAALSIVYTVSVEVDKHGVAIFATILAILLGWNNLGLLFHNWQLLLIGVAAYGIAGGAWSVFRWFKYCRKYIEEHPNEKISLIEGYGDNKRTLTLEQYYSEKLNPSAHKSKLISWIVYWPFSLFWHITGDIINTIYDMFANSYARVSASVISNALGKKP
jgi:hypothetical protein